MSININFFLLKNINCNALKFYIRICVQNAAENCVRWSNVIDFTSEKLQISFIPLFYPYFCSFAFPLINVFSYFFITFFEDEPSICIYKSVYNEYSKTESGKLKLQKFKTKTMAYKIKFY